MAAYRDDREALRDRADQLERELREAKVDLQAKELVIAHADAEVDRLRKKAGERPPTAKRTLLVPLVVLSATAAGGAAVFLMARRSDEALDATPPIAASPAADEARDVETQPTEAAHTVLRFGGRVTSVTGRKDVVVGDACDLQVDTAIVAGRLSFDEVVIRCGDVELHRMTAPGGALLAASNWAAGPAADDAEGRWIASYEDLGPRSANARSQAAFDTEREVGRVFTEGAVTTEVRLSVDRLGVAR